MDPRLFAYRIIERVEKNAYSNLALDGAMRECSLSPRDKAFAARLVYGVTERRLTLRHIISCYSDRSADNIDRQILIILEMGIYQLYFMNVPDSAAVNESVNLAKVLKKSSGAGFVNAVLRRAVKEGKVIPPVQGDVYEQLSMEFSCPATLIRRICEGYGEKKAVSLLKASLEQSVTVLRVNTLKTNAASLAENLSARGIETEIIGENALLCRTLKNVEVDPDFMAGNYHVQDLSSQLCCMAAAPKAGDTVIDMCAAPGGKTITMAELMEDKGRIFACELHEKRTRLILSGAERMGIGCITAVTNDARVHNDALPLADVVLCDVPCSGYGVIRGKPEIKYKPLSEADKLPAVQLDILKAASEYVKAGGVLVYSTCTVNIEENERVIEKFLDSTPMFAGDMFPGKMGDHFKGKFMTAIFPADLPADGFFICRMRKEG